MTSKKTLNAKNLEALGAERLAALLIEVTTGDATAKRRLRMELAAAQGPKEIAAEIRKRLNSIARARSFVDWQGVKALARDLEMQRQAICQTVGNEDPKIALDLMWRFMDMARPVYDRCDDSSGLVGDVFRTGCRDIGDLALKAQADPKSLADRAFDALVVNEYAQFDHLIPILAPALGNKGLEHLKQRMITLSKTPIERPADKDRVQVMWGSGGPVYEDEIEERSRRSTVSIALKDIADAMGDVDAFIAQYDEKTRQVPKIAADIANRLVAADRADEALKILDAAVSKREQDWEWPAFDYEDARIATLDALGRQDEAQELRWSCFERSLSTSHLRAYLKKLPDFDDFEAEEKALAHAVAYRNPTVGLHFLIEWPALDRAAELINSRREELDGNYYEVLTPAADALAEKYPLAATVVLRAMIDFTIIKARSSRYKHAAKHFKESARLALSIEDFGNVETHQAYEASLRRDHGRKTSFWSLLD